MEEFLTRENDASLMFDETLFFGVGVKSQPVEAVAGVSVGSLAETTAGVSLGSLAEATAGVLPGTTTQASLGVSVNYMVRSRRLFSFGAFKRLFDFTVALLMLVFLSPILLIVAVVIKIDSRGPVLFRQRRTGKDGKEFEILKFRSMVADNDVRDMSSDDKYTKFGKMIRRVSIDELPQLINILKGEMSFVGPRPWVPEYFENMNERQRGRVMVRPGITGLAQAKGRNGLSVFEKINFDLEYVQNFSLKQDVKVVFLTVKTVVAREGVDAGKGQIHSDIEDLKRENFVGA